MKPPLTSRDEAAPEAAQSGPLWLTLAHCDLMETGVQASWGWWEVGGEVKDQSKNGAIGNYLGTYKFLPSSVVGTYVDR